MKKIIGLYTLLALLAFVSFGIGTQASNQDDFVEDAAQMGMAEVMLGNLAAQRAQSEDVRRYAQKMVEDHTAANNQLKEIAARKNMTVPTDVEPKQRAMMNKLGALSGMNFDRAYMKQMVKDHEKAVKMFQKQSERGTDAKLKAFAAAQLPALQQHLEMARSMYASMKGSKNNENSNSGANSDMNMNSNQNTNSNRNTNGNTNSNSNDNSQ
jgi:putative membrane protein